MTPATFKTLAEGWQHYLECFAKSLTPKQIHEHKRAFYAGALSYGAILFNSCSAGPEASNATIKGIHDEGQAFAREQIAACEANPNN